MKKKTPIAIDKIIYVINLPKGFYLPHVRKGRKVFPGDGKTKVMDNGS